MRLNQAFIACLLLFRAMLSALPTIAQAQNTSPTPDGLEMLKSILPPSPSASQLMKFEDIPVSKATGAASINIPIYELRGQGISVPISLSYHPSGVKVDEVATPVGLGWSLNAGGMVSRTVRGKPDEMTGGFIGHPIYDDFVFERDYLNMKHIADGSLDGTFDIFNFNFQGFSGKFVFDGQGKIHTIPHQNLKIAYQKNTCFTRFTITTPDGIVYDFSETETSKTTESGTGGCRKTPGSYSAKTVPTSWLLTKISNPNTQDEVLFFYDKRKCEYEMSVTQTVTSPILPSTQPVSCNPANLSKCITTKDDDECILNRIESSMGVVEFNNWGNREDLMFPSQGNRLTQIRIKNPQGDVLKIFDLEQSFIASTGYSASVESSAFKRMYLESVTERDAAGQANPSYQFRYQHRDLLPPRLSPHQDHWGFYNGNSNSGTDFLPVTTEVPNYVYQHYSINPVSKETDPTTSLYGILDKVTYPTGGYTELEYESHQYTANEPQKQIRQFAAAAQSTCDTNTDPNAPVCAQATEDEQIFTLTVATDVEINRSVEKRTDVPPQLSTGSMQTGVALFQQVGNNWTSVTIPAPVLNFQALGTYMETATQVWNALPTIPLFTLSPGTYKVKAVTNFDEERSSIVLTYYETLPSALTTHYVGGARAKLIKNYDAINPAPIVKKYEYEEGVPLFIRPKYVGGNTWLSKCPQDVYVQTVNPSLGGAFCLSELISQYVVSSNSEISMNNMSGANIGYKKVTEYNGLNGENGKVVETYTCVQDVPAEPGEVLNPSIGFLNGPGIDMSWKNGKMLTSEIYKQNNGSFQLIQKTENEYHIDETRNNTEVIGMSARLRADPCNDSYENPISVVNCDGDISDDYFVWGCEGNFVIFDLIPQITPNGCITSTISYTQHLDTIVAFPALGSGNKPCFVLNTTCDTLYGYCYYHPNTTATLSNTYLLNAFSTELTRAQSQWEYLTKTTQKRYDDANQVLETVTEYEYEDAWSLNPTKVRTTNSDGTQQQTCTKYVTQYPLQPFNPATFSNDVKALWVKFITYQHNSPVEVLTQQKKVGGQWETIGGKLTKYALFNNVLSPAEVHALQLDVPTTVAFSSIDPITHSFTFDTHYQKKEIIDALDTKAHPLQLHRDNDIPVALLWDYNNRLPVAKCVNATHHQIFYSSFETNGEDKGNWTYNSNAITTNAAKTGTQSFVLSPQNAITCPSIPSGVAFNLSFFAKANGANAQIEVNGTPITITNTWQLYQVPISNANQVSITAVGNVNTWIDELKMMPQGAVMNTYTYDKFYRITSETSVEHTTVHYLYDSFGRLEALKDDDGNILKKYSYHYGQ